MDKLLARYNESIEANDVAKLKKKVKRIKDQEKPKEKKASHEEGDDGWITVHYKRGNDKKQAKLAKKKDKKAEKEKLVNFYAFEMKEAKLQKHKELLAKFEEDKKRLQKMREQRKFKI